MASTHEGDVLNPGIASEGFDGIGKADEELHDVRVVPTRGKARPNSFDEVR